VDRILADRSDEQITALPERFPTKKPKKAKKEADPWGTDFRSPQMHDRDRILYSGAFQRLGYVTQVTAPESGLTFHNRLSHSFKVAQVGRRNAERLRALVEQKVIKGAAARLVGSVDPDAVEAACLAHDLGHPPFGHIAEEVLQQRAAEQQIHDRFEGNAQSFRIVTRLAQRATGSGLNLTRQTLDGLLKYPWGHWNKDPRGDHKRERKWGYYSDDAEVFDWVRKGQPKERAKELPRQSIEAAIMEWADDLTYAVHDVDDFYRAGLVPLDRLGDEDGDEMKQLEQLLQRLDAEEPGSLDASVEEIVETAEILFPGKVPSGPYRNTREDRRHMRRMSSDLITDYLSAFVIENAPEGGVRLRIDDSVNRQVAALKALVRIYVIRRPGIAVVQHGQKRVIGDLFDFYLKASAEEGGDRRLFPPGYRTILEREPDALERRVRVVIDLISGLTEESAIQLYRRLIGGSAAPVLDATAQMV
jgi:dGTPase